MVKKIRSLDEFVESAFDVVEAIKRVLIKRGLVREKPEAKQRQSIPKTSGRLQTAAIKSHDVLFKANTVFPFTLFPDTVTLDREKLSFAERFFFAVAKVTSVPVRDILSVEADVGPFFGSVRTASRYFVTNPKSINFLWRKDAVQLQRLLQGYIIVHEQEIDCTNTPTKDLVKLLNDLGKGDTD